MTNKSAFYGTTFGLIIRIIVVNLLTYITFGIYLPWGVNWLVRYIIENMSISGRKLEYRGRGSNIFSKYIIWYLLSIITCGIFALTIPNRMIKYIVQNTHFKGENKESTFIGDSIGQNVFDSINYNIIFIFIGSFFFFGIFTYYLLINLVIKIIKNTTIDGQKIYILDDVEKYPKYKWSLFGKNLLNILLLVVTFGIYGYFLPIKGINWVVNRLLLVDENDTETIKKCERYNIEMICWYTIISIMIILPIFVICIIPFFFVIAVAYNTIKSGSFYKDEIIIFNYACIGLTIFSIIIFIFESISIIKSTDKVFNKIIYVILGTAIFSVLPIMVYNLNKTIYIEPEYDFYSQGQYYQIDSDNKILYLVKIKNNKPIFSSDIKKEKEKLIGYYDTRISLQRYFNNDFQDDLLNQISNYTISISADAMTDNSIVIDVILSERVTRVDYGAFRNCDNLKNAYIKHVGTFIYNMCFIDCDNRVHIQLYENKPN